MKRNNARQGALLAITTRWRVTVTDSKSTPTLEVQHTPGPWHIFADVVTGRDSVLGAAIVDDTPEKHFICRVVRLDAREQYVPNAALLAAAPDLLAALEKVERWLQDESLMPPEDLIDDVCSAIALARGQQ